MTAYQGFLSSFLVTSCFGFFTCIKICAGEMADPILNKEERWILILCWGLVIIWPVSVMCLIISFT